MQVLLQTLKQNVVCRQHLLQHGRHKRKRRYLFSFESLQNGIDFEIREEHVLAAHPRDCPDSPGINKMEDRSNVQPDVGVGELKLCDGAECIESAVSMS